MMPPYFEPAVVAAKPSLPVSLHEVDEWLAGDEDPSLVLANIACLIGNRLLCDACSLYRLDHQRQSLILAATVGLRQICVEALTMNITEGLCGLVVQQRRPISVAAQAAAHPRFKYFPEAGEEPYETFLGVPIVDVAQIVGVLVVQTVAARSFTDVEEQMLALTGRQIGPILTRLSCGKESP